MKKQEYDNKIAILRSEFENVLSRLGEDRLNRINHSNWDDESIGINLKMLNELRQECEIFNACSRNNQSYVHDQFDIGNGEQNIQRLENILLKVKSVIASILKEEK